MPNQVRSILLNRRRWNAAAACAAGAAWTIGATGSVWAARALFRGAPPPLSMELGPGLTYRRMVISSPRRNVAHVVTANLSLPSIEVVVTPIDRESEFPFLARTTEEFFCRHSLAVAINGDYFSPWRCNNPIDYAPKSGDCVACMGPTASQGRLFVPASPGYYTRKFDDCTWFFSAGSISMSRPKGRQFCAISGGPILVRGALPACAPGGKPNPQTAIAADRNRSTLSLVVVDGRQPDFSEGLSDHELAMFLIDLGAWSALRLDGGGSSTMVLRSPRGRTWLANRPIHAGIPGWQRPVANHLGIRLRT